MEFKVLHSADLHGNESQYTKLVNHAIAVSADALILGGDITPWSESDRQNVIQHQHKFIQKKLPALLQPFKDKLPDSKIYLMLGNDDCAVNMDALKEAGGDLYNVVHGRRMELTPDFDIVGYSYVPITPFGLKDWEKFDLSEVPEELNKAYSHRQMTNYRYDGIKSTKNGWETFKFKWGIEKKESIQKDLTHMLFTTTPEKTVYVAHTPPNSTNLDLTCNNRHLGSFALTEFIQKHQPYLTLHGHIHETVYISGQFTDWIGKTQCMAPGNHDRDQAFSLLEFDLYNPREARRLIL